MKKTLLPLLLSILLGSLVSGCYYDKEEDLYGSVPACDTSNVTYTNTIVSIMQQSCNSCHSSGNATGVNLDNYPDLAYYAGNGHLMGTINHSSGFSAMPKDQPQIDNCAITKLNIWIRQGYLQN
ncbi:MAG: hypothetical protein WCO63_06030 [Bacteroidota bacterium]